MSKLKLDLHPIFNNSALIFGALEETLRLAEEKGISEIEVIPGKGSGALKKSVLRYLNQPDVRSRYHRIVKDGDNWGRLFIYFKKADRSVETVAEDIRAPYNCFYCTASAEIQESDLPEDGGVVECPACGCLNRLHLHWAGKRLEISAEDGYAGQ